MISISFHVDMSALEGYRCPRKTGSLCTEEDHDEGFLLLLDGKLDPVTDSVGKKPFDETAVLGVDNHDNGKGLMLCQH